MIEPRFASQAVKAQAEPSEVDEGEQHDEEIEEAPRKRRKGKEVDNKRKGELEEEEKALRKAIARDQANILGLQASVKAMVGRLMEIERSLGA